MGAEVFSNKSMIDILNDEVVSSVGEYSRDIMALELKGNSRVSFKCDFSEPLETTKLKVVYDILGNESSTRYNNSLGINLKIMMCKQEYENGDFVFKDSIVKTVNIIPYKNTEDKGNYTNEIVDIDYNFIKQLEVTIYFYSDNTDDKVIIDSLGVYNTAIVTENTVENVVQQTVEKDFTGKFSCIDILYEDPDPTTVPNGYMYILYRDL